MVKVKIDTIVGTSGASGVYITLEVNGVDKIPRPFLCNSDLTIRFEKSNCSVSAEQTLAVYSSGLLVHNPVLAECFIVNGVATSNVEELFEEINKIECFASNVAPEPIDYTQQLDDIKDCIKSEGDETQELLQEQLDKIHHDPETSLICVKDDPNSHITMQIEQVFLVSDGLEDLTKRRFLTENGTPTTAPTLFSWGACKTNEKLSTKETFTATAGQTVFTLSEFAANVDVRVSRASNEETVDHTFTNNNTITLLAPLLAGDLVVIRKFFI